MKYVLKKADQTEVEEIFSLYLKRIQWMNEKELISGTTMVIGTIL